MLMALSHLFVIDHDDFVSVKVLFHLEHGEIPEFGFFNLMLRSNVQRQWNKIKDLLEQFFLLN